MKRIQNRQQNANQISQANFDLFSFRPPNKQYFQKLDINVYYMACVCSEHDARSDWLILGHYSPVMLPR